MEAVQSRTSKEVHRSHSSHGILHALDSRISTTIASGSTSSATAVSATASDLRAFEAALVTSEPLPPPPTPANAHEHHITKYRNTRIVDLRGTQWWLLQERRCSHDEQVRDGLQALRGHHRHDDEQIAREREHHGAQAEEHERQQPERAHLQLPRVLAARRPSAASCHVLCVRGCRCARRRRVRCGATDAKPRSRGQERRRVAEIESRRHGDSVQVLRELRGAGNAAIREREEVVVRAAEQVETIADIEANGRRTVARRWRWSDEQCFGEVEAIASENHWEVSRAIFVA